jgi:hypothetical protein
VIHWLHELDRAYIDLGIKLRFMNLRGERVGYSLGLAQDIESGMARRLAKWRVKPARLLSYFFLSINGIQSPALSLTESGHYQE